MNSINVIKWSLNTMEFLACFTGFLYFRKIKNSHWKFFPFYLGFIFLIEMTAKWAQRDLSNIQFVLNLYKYVGIPIQFLFFFWIFFKHDQQKDYKTWSFTALLIYVISFIFDEFFMKGGVYWFNSISYTCGNIVLLVLIIRYFYHLTKSNELLYFREKQMFWVCLGLLIFYLGTMPYFGLYNTLRNNYPALFKLYWHLQMALNICMYACFSISFIWSKSK